MMAGRPVPPTSGNDGTPIFRVAEPREDGMLSRILCNAFIPVWNHNWFCSATQPLEPVPIGTLEHTPSMTRIQRSRVAFYRALVGLTRLAGGSVLVAEVRGTVTSTGATPEIGAILMWLPPHVRPSTGLTQLYSSGFLNILLPWNYGFAGYNRVERVFERNIKEMWDRTLPNLPPQGFKEEDCAFVQMIASNPKYAGIGYASALLKHQIEAHFREFSDRPVILDTTTAQGVRAYERLGFKMLAEVLVDTGTDERGIKLKPDASEEVRGKGKETCVQRVMAKLPGNL